MKILADEPAEKSEHDVIVCVHNGHADVELCIESLTRTWKDEDLSRLIIVDDGSDKTMQDFLKVKESEFDFISGVTLSGQNYYTKSANIGLRESNARYRTLLNSDTIVTEGWAKRIRRVLSIHSRIGIVGPLSNAASTQSVPFVKSSKDQTAINTMPDGVSLEEFAEFIAQTGSCCEIPFVPLVHGFCLTVNSDVIDEIGLFDEESFPRGYGEENDYCFRAEDAGFLLAIAVDTFVFHAKSKSYQSDERTKFMHDGMKKFVEKHGVDRIKKAVSFMELNPHLQYVRERVLNQWSTHYLP